MGRYRRGQRHGLGLYVFKNGARYLGDYRCQLKHGVGKFYYPDGSTYEGEWKKDLKHGHGIYVYQNGDIYEGAWYKGKPHGVGNYYFKEADVTFHGTWVNGVRMGPVEIIFDKHRYHGVWEDRDPVGTGVYSFQCRWMNTGFIKMERDPDLDVLDDDAAAGARNEPGEPRTMLPIWKSQKILNYDYSKLPQEPMPQPIPDSDADECEPTPQPSALELMKFECIPGEEEENEEVADEMEMAEAESP